MLKKNSQNMAMSLFFAICALAAVIYGTHVFAENYFAADHSFLQESSSGAVALYILSDTGNAESSTQFEFDVNPCMIPVLFTIQTGTLNQTDADHIRCIFSYNGTETESDSVNLWRSIACSDGAIEDNGDQITANSPVLLSDLEYDVQTDGTSMFYAGIVYLQVPVTFDAQSNLTLAVSTIPDQVVLGQSGLALTPYSNGFQNGVTVNGNSSMALFDSYINAWRNTFSFQTSTATTASSGSRSGNSVFDAKIQSYENGTMTYSSSCTVPTNTRFGNVTSANTNVVMAGKLPGYLGGYSNRVVSDSVPRLQINIEIPKTVVNNLYANNEAAEKGYLSFNYSYSAPVEPGGNGTESNPYTAVPPADGHFRIWRNGNQSAGEAASVPVVSGTDIPISNFLYYRPGYPEDEYVVSVNLEAVRHSETALPITVTLLNSNHQPVANSSATINVQPVLCGLQIDSNNDGTITMDDEYVEHAMFKILPLSTAENPVYTPVKLTFAKVYNNTLPITLRQKFNVTQPNGVTFYEKTGSGENVTYTPISLQNQVIDIFFANSESANYYARTVYIKADSPVLADDIDLLTAGPFGDIRQVKDEILFSTGAPVLQINATDLDGDVVPVDGNKKAYVHWNIDNDNNSAVIAGQNSKHPGGDYQETGTVVGENDLQAFTISVLSAIPTKGTISLSVGSAGKVWKSATKGANNLLVNSGQTISWDLSNAVKRTELANLGTLYIEGVNEGECDLLFSFALNNITSSDTVKYYFIAANCGDQPSSDQKLDLFGLGLVDCEWSIIGQKSSAYNCIAWSIGENNIWYISHGLTTGRYLLSSGEYINVENISTEYGNRDGIFDDNKIIAFYEQKGFVQTQNINEAKVIYYNGFHGAKRRQENEDCMCCLGKRIMFESKCGGKQVVEHPWDKIGGKYGSPHIYFK